MGEYTEAFRPVKGRHTKFLSLVIGPKTRPKHYAIAWSQFTGGQLFYSSAKKHKALSNPYLWRFIVGL